MFLKIVPILKITYPNEDFIMFIDTCKEGLGGVLMQNGHVVSYEFGKLKICEEHFSTRDLKLETIVHALKIWRHYLMIKRLKLRANHNGLK